MYEVLAQIVSYVRATWRRRWIIILVAWVVALGGWIWVYSLPDQYRANARVYVDTQSLLRPLLSGLAVQPNTSQQVAMMTRTLISRPNIEKVARMTDLDIQAKNQVEMDRLINGLMASIRLKGDTRTNLYSISYQHENPELAKKVVQALLTIFVEESLGSSRKDIATSQQFIEQQLKVYEDKLIAAEDALKDFKRRNVGTLPGQGGDYFSKLSESKAQLAQAQLELREAEYRRDSLKKQVSGAEPTLMATPSTTQTSELDGRIGALQAKLDEMKLRYTDQHPDVVGTKRIIAQLEEQKRKEAQMSSGPTFAVGDNPYIQQLNVALAEAEAQVSSLRARVGEYSARYAGLQAAVDRIPEVEAEYKQLMRDYDVYKRNYDALLAKRESAVMAGEVDTKTNVIDFRVIEPPRVPLKPSAPNRPFLLSIVLLAALGTGIAVAFLISQIRPTVDDRRVLRDISGLPVLGSVSMFENKEIKRRKRNRLLAFVMSVVSLIGAYSVLIVLQLVLARAA